MTWQDELTTALKDLEAVVTAQDDQVRAMTDKELGAKLASGHWGTIEVHEAARRLLRSDN